MAHKLMTIGEFGAAFAYNKQGGDPWHRLGRPMDGLQTAEEMLTAAYADYTVEAAPCYTLVQVPEWQPGVISTEREIDGIHQVVFHKLVQVEGKQVTYANHPITGEPQALGVTGMRYTIAQNQEVVDRALAIVEADGEALVETAGVMDDMRKFFALIDLGGLVIDPAGVNDAIANDMVVSPSRDGSAAIQYTMTNVRVVCNNTLRAALRNAKNYFRAKHTPNYVSNLDEARKALGINVSWATEFAKMAEEMLAIPFTNGDMSNLVDAMWKPEGTSVGERAKKNHDDKQDLLRGIFNNGKNVGHVGNNAWAAYNAIGEYLDHHRADDADAMALTTMDEGSWVTKDKVKAQELILAMAN